MLALIECCWVWVASIPLETFGADRSRMERIAPQPTGCGSYCRTVWGLRRRLRCVYQVVILQPRRTIRAASLNVANDHVGRLHVCRRSTAQRARRALACLRRSKITAEEDASRGVRNRVCRCVDNMRNTRGITLHVGIPVHGHVPLCCIQQVIVLEGADAAPLCNRGGVWYISHAHGENVILLGTCVLYAGRERVRIGTARGIDGASCEVLCSGSMHVIISYRKVPRIRESSHDHHFHGAMIIAGQSTC